MNFKENLRSVLDSDKKSPKYPSFIFGMHKGGSTMLHKFFNILTSKSNVKSLNAPGIAFEAGLSDEQFSYDNDLATYFRERAIYFGFRYVPSFLLQNKSLFLNHKSIVLLRDPRDCVVSAYFSFLKSHPLSQSINSGMSEQILRERLLNEGVDIDSYCVKECYRFAQEILEYICFCTPNTKVYRYEDIIFNKREFFINVLEHLSWEVEARVFEEALTAVDIVPKKEDTNSHIRSVKPGSHTEKLKEGTVNKLNVLHSKVLEVMGY